MSGIAVQADPPKKVVRAWLESIRNTQMRDLYHYWVGVYRDWQRDNPDPTLQDWETALVGDGYSPESVVAGVDAIASLRKWMAKKV